MARVQKRGARGPGCSRHSNGGGENASGHARTPLRPLENRKMTVLSRRNGGDAVQDPQDTQTDAARMRAGTHERHFGHLTSFMKNSKVTKHLCFISKNLRQQNSQSGHHRFVETKRPLFRKISVSSRGNEGGAVQGAQQ